MSGSLSDDPEVIDAKRVHAMLRDAARGDVDAQRWLSGFWWGYDESEGGHPALILNSLFYARLAFANTRDTGDLGQLINVLDRAAERHHAAGDLANAEVSDAEVIALVDIAADRPGVSEVLGPAFLDAMQSNLERALANLSDEGRELSRRFLRVYRDYDNAG